MVPRPQRKQKTQKLPKDYSEKEKKKWSQEKLAAESEVSYNTSIKIERGGIKDPRIGTVIKLAKTLGVKVDELSGLLV